MDYHELARAVNLCGSAPSILKCRQGCPYWDGGNMVRCIPRMTADAATAISDLLSRAGAAEAAQETLQKSMAEYKARAEKAERERDAAVSDIETIMAYGGGTCQFCGNGHCYARGGKKPCLPKWRGRKAE